MKNIIILCFLITGMQAYAQKSIRLLDKTTGHAIANAHFLYHNQKGISSEKGLISIQPITDASLQISHVNYGKIEIDNKAVLSALNSGVLNLSESYISLMPATVIARSNGKGDSHVVKVTNSDKLSHDAGDFLSQNAFIGGIRKSGSYGFDPVMRGFKYDQLNIVKDNG